MRIDAHHHFWHYTPAEYDWIDDAMASIRRDFLPADLAPEIASANIDAVISVQARQTLDETEALLTWATAHSWIVGVVGWLPLIDPAVGDQLDRLAANPELKGMRHVL
ncbi:MAG: amidohydrolase family protein, partial [Acidobacteriaceae bacterium]